MKLIEIDGLPNYETMEIALKTPENFLIVKETLTRIGIPSKEAKKLTQTCHILHKRGKYYIMHFKELFALDGKATTLNESDLQRRNLIGNLLAEWGLVDIVEPSLFVDEADLSSVKILPASEANEWELISKYSIGTKKR
jgi:hypothetical protein